jgi:ADP-heptose:LPS heptosyltransferase
VLNRGSNRCFTHPILHRTLAHEVEQNLALLSALGLSIPAGCIRLPPVPTDAAGAHRLLPRGDGAPLLALALFAHEPKRMLPPQRLALAVRLLCARFGFAVAILGLAADAEAGKAFADAIGPRAFSLCDRTTILEAADVIREAALLLGMDSGPVHLAAAAETPVAVISCHPRDGDARHENSPRLPAVGAARPLAGPAAGDGAISLSQRLQCRAGALHPRDRARDDRPRDRAVFCRDGEHAALSIDPVVLYD